MHLKVTLSGIHYQFQSVKDVMAKANEVKSGDALAGVAAESTAERIAAKVVLSQLTLNDLYEHPAVDYDHDEVTRIIIDDSTKSLESSLTTLTMTPLTKSKIGP